MPVIFIPSGCLYILTLVVKRNERPASQDDDLMQWILSPSKLFRPSVRHF
jgi:hypothetical protein